MDDLVSVVIPTYNRSAICRKAVVSVLDQTYPNIEVIVVDDGSSDNTRGVFDSINPRVRCIRQANAGVSAARNTGIRECRGEYIAFLDSDDVWLPWKVEAQLAVLEAFPEAGMVWTDMTSIDEKGHELQRKYLTTMYEAYRLFDRDRAFSRQVRLGEIWHDCIPELSNTACYYGDIHPWMFLGNLVHTSTVLLRRNRCLQVGEFDTGLLKSGEDYDFHLRTCQLGPVAFIDYPSIHYRIGAADQLTSNEYMIWVARNNLKTVLAAHERSGGHIGLPNILVRDRLAQSHLWVGMAEFHSDRYAARKAIRLSLRYRPWQQKALLFYLLTFLSPGVFDRLNLMRRRLYPH